MRVAGGVSQGMRSYQAVLCVFSFIGVSACSTTDATPTPDAGQVEDPGPAFDVPDEGPPPTDDGTPIDAPDTPPPPEDVPDTPDVPEVETPDVPDVPDTPAPDEGPEIIEPTPCEAEPCPAKATDCVEDVLTQYADPTCDDVTGKAKCDWAVAAETDCAVDGLVCIDAQCVFPENVLDGHANIGSAEDVAKFSAYTVIEGNLVFSGEITEVSLPHLHTVIGAVRIEGHATLETLSLAALKTIAAQLYIKDNTALLDLALPALSSVGTKLTVFGNKTLPALELPALTAVGSEATLVNNVGLATVSAPWLASIGGPLLVMNNTDLETLVLDQLKTIPGLVRVTKNAALTSVPLPALSELEGDVVVRNNDALDTVDLSGLEATPGTIAVYQNATLTSMDVSALATVAGALALKDNPMLAEVAASALSSVDGPVMLMDLAALTGLELPGLVFAGSDLLVRQNETLESLDLGALKAVNGKLVIDSDPALSALTLPALETVGGALLVAKNDALVSAAAPLLAELGGTLVVSANAALTEISMPAITTTGLTYDWTFGSVPVAGGSVDGGGLVASHTLIGEERIFPIKDNQYNQIVQFTDLEDQDVTDMVEEDCTLGDTHIYLEALVADLDYVFTNFEYTKNNNSKGMIVALPAPEGGWKVGWNTITASAGNYACSASEGCNNICETPWDQMNRLELYRTGPKTGTIQGDMGVRNVRLEKFGLLGGQTVGKTIAVINNGALPQCVVDAFLASAAAQEAPVVAAGNLEGCTCTEEAPIVATCPPPEEPEDPPQP